MRDLVQLASPQRNSVSRVERAGTRAGDSTFSDALQVKTGKKSVADGAEDGAADAKSGFRIGAGGHSAARLPISVAVESKLFQRIAADEAATETMNQQETGEIVLPAGLQATDGEASDLPGRDGGLPAASAVAPSEPVIEAGHASLDEDALDGGEAQQPDASVRADAAAPGSGDIRTWPGLGVGQSSSLDGQASGSAETATASLIVPAERVTRTGRAPSPGGEADAGEASASPHPASEAVKAAGFAALAPAQKAQPPATKPAVATALANGVVEEAAAESGDIEESTEMPRKALPLMEKGLSEPQRTPASVKVIDAHSLPAPGQMPSPASSVSQAITEASDWMSFARVSGTEAATAAPSAAAPVKALTIQLHPAELGMVTAKLRFVGDQLTIELQVERGNAFEKLSADGETILKAVRALGIEVDRVTVQQQPTPSALNARSENGASFNGGGREASFSAQGDSGGRESGGTGGNSSGGDAQDEVATYTTGGGNATQSSSGRGVYI